MTLRPPLLLFLLGLSINLFVASYQSSPGYIDADYYFAGGLQLVQGKGFTEPYIWNYLDGSTSIPHPSHTYWMPLASIISAIGMWILGQHTYAAARFPFILLSACVPVMTFYLADSFLFKRSVSITASLLSVFSLYYVPFMPVTDNYPVFVILGGAFLFISSNETKWKFLALGLIAGLLTLARTDGILWMGLIIIFAWMYAPTNSVKGFFVSIVISLTGYLLIMGWWHWRTWELFHTILTPGGEKLLWLTKYEEIFSFPPTRLSFQHLLAQGLENILSSRLHAIIDTFRSAIYLQFNMILFPFTVWGIWLYRHEERTRLALFGWLFLFLMMTILFPFAGQRGSFHHSGAAFQSIWWIMAAAGLDSLAMYLEKRRILYPFLLVNGLFVFLITILTIQLFNFRVIKSGWSKDDYLIPTLKSSLFEFGIKSGDVVLAKNPPGFYLATGNPSIIIPYGDTQTLLLVAKEFDAQYLVVEDDIWMQDLNSLYLHPEAFPAFNYLGSIDGLKVFKIISP